MPALNVSTGKIPVVCFSDNGKAWEETIKFLIGFIVQMLLVVVIVVSDGDGAHVARDVGLAILLHHHRPGGQDVKCRSTWKTCWTDHQGRQRWFQQ